MPSTAQWLATPSEPDGVFTVAQRSDHPDGERTIQIDQYSGRALEDASFERYGAVARIVEWGVTLHTVVAFGRANQMIVLAAVIAIIALSLSELWMWISRRSLTAEEGVGGSDYRTLSAWFVATLVGLGLFLRLWAHQCCSSCL